ncbi:MAG: ArsR/SmtB family transcription factor [Lachnospiraceae bacterium]
MQGEVLRKVNYLEEAYHLLCQVAEDRKTAATREKMISRYGVTDKEALEIYDLLEEILADAQKYFLDKKETVLFYFASHSGTEGILARFILFGSAIEGDCSAETVEQLREKFKKMSKQDCLDQTYFSCCQWDSFFNDSIDEGPKSMSDIFAYILEMGISDKEKLLLQDCIIHREKHLEAVLSLLADAMDFLKQYAARMQIWCEKTADYWEKLLSEKDFQEFMSSRTGITLDDNPMGYVVLPRVLETASFSFTCEMKKKNGKARIQSGYILRAGFMTEQYVPIKNMMAGSEIETEEQVLQVFKILSDKSKFEILKYIWNRRAYGGELAKQLNLTTATISHHMSVLIAAGLVELEKEDNKIYYRADKKELGRILQYCEMIFKDEV